jgi:hypothetical protein
VLKETGKSYFFALRRRPDEERYRWEASGTSSGRHPWRVCGSLAGEAIRTRQIAVSRPLDRTMRSDLATVCAVLGVLPRLVDHGEVLVWDALSFGQATVLSVWSGVKQKTLKECPKCIAAPFPDRALAPVFVVNPKKRRQRLCERHLEQRRLRDVRIPREYRRLAQIVRNRLDYAVVVAKTITRQERTVRWVEFKTAAAERPGVETLRRQLHIPRIIRRGAPPGPRHPG